jgi:spore germination protein
MGGWLLHFQIASAAFSPAGEGQRNHLRPAPGSEKPTIGLTARGHQYGLPASAAQRPRLYIECVQFAGGLSRALALAVLIGPVLLITGARPPWASRPAAAATSTDGAALLAPVTPDLQPGPQVSDLFSPVLANAEPTPIPGPELTSIPAPEPDRPRALLRWAYMVGNTLPDAVRQHPEDFDYLSPAWFHLDGNGEVYGTGSPSVERFAQQHGIKLVPIVANGEFDPDVAHAMLTDGTLQTQALDSLEALLSNSAYAGINVDFENLYTADRQGFSAFMANLYARLHPLGNLVTIALPAKTDDKSSAFSAPFDYAGLAPNFDLAVIMTYDYHYAGSQAGALAPLDWDGDVIKYATRFIVPDKLILGVPFYGYDWNVSYGGWASALGYDQIVRTIFAHGGAPYMDPYAHTPVYTYSGWDGTHQIWFENSTSLSYKLKLAEDTGLAGWGAWRLGMEDPNFWSLDLGATEPLAAPVPPMAIVQAVRPLEPIPAPSVAAAAPPPAPAAAQPPIPPLSSVVVAAGDTLSAIAARTGTSVEALIAANHLGPAGFVLAGQTLTLSGSAPAPVRAAGPKNVRVGVGETLSIIAGRYGTTVRALLSANRLSSPDRIQAGQVLTIPAA